MLEMNMKADINNIGFLDYMENQEKSNVEPKRTLRESRPPIAENQNRKIINPNNHPRLSFIYNK